jgi:protein dithiol oxidoreductase (disulfide-forming)
MDRRLFALGALACPIAAFPESAPEEKWQPGVHYIKLPPNAASSLPSGRIEVVEVFSYTCVHCYHFEPFLHEWLAHKPEYLDFVKIPGVWVDWQRPYATMYYALKLLGRGDLEHSVFEGIHADRSLPVKNPDDINTALLEFATRHSIPESDFKRAFASSAVQSQLQTDARRIEAYQIVATPSMVIDRKYATDASRVLASSDKPGDAAFGRLLELTNHLVGNEAALLHLHS